jgi:hypothetical protein
MPENAYPNGGAASKAKPPRSIKEILQSLSCSGSASDNLEPVISGCIDFLKHRMSFFFESFPDLVAHAPEGLIERIDLLGPGSLIEYSHAYQAIIESIFLSSSLLKEGSLLSLSKECLNQMHAMLIDLSNFSEFIFVNGTGSHAIESSDYGYQQQGDVKSHLYLLYQFSSVYSLLLNIFENISPSEMGVILQPGNREWLLLYLADLTWANCLSSYKFSELSAYSLLSEACDIGASFTPMAASMLTQGPVKAASLDADSAALDLPFAFDSFEEGSGARESFEYAQFRKIAQMLLIMGLSRMETQRLSAKVLEILEGEHAAYQNIFHLESLMEFGFSIQVHMPLVSFLSSIIDGWSVFKNNFKNINLCLLGYEAKELDFEIIKKQFVSMMQQLKQLIERSDRRLLARGRPIKVLIESATRLIDDMNSYYIHATQENPFQLKLISNDCCESGGWPDAKPLSVIIASLQKYRSLAQPAGRKVGLRHRSFVSSLVGIAEVTGEEDASSAAASPSADLH